MLDFYVHDGVVIPCYNRRPMAQQHVRPPASGQEVLSRLAKDGTAFGSSRVQEVYEYAQECYKGSMHWSGQTTFEHTVGVLDVLAQFEPDEDTVIACLLYHVLHHKCLTLLELEERYGPKIRSLVSGIHLLSHVTLDGRRRSIEDLRLMLLSVSDDIRVLLVSFCDRAYCLRFIDRMDPERARRLCQDVLQIFAPVAARLGIYTLKHELENRAFPVLYPSDAERIREQLGDIHREHPEFLKGAADALRQFLQKQGIDANVQGREKHIYSIFQKMHRKSLTSIRDIYDLFALRVIVRTPEECYRVLGMLHGVGRPLGNRFKDYIAFPKPNGYQSLHTTLTSVEGMPEGTSVEVQIRTEDMDREARFGVAAHWSYKEYGATKNALEKVQLHAMLVGQEAVSDHSAETTFADHIFVLTPRGDIVELPEGATPLDFAFQVHTDLGLSFRSARVNGSIVPLDYELQNGDVVEIQKNSHPQISPKWMQMLKMASSRSKLKRYLYLQERDMHVAEGRELVNEELRKHGLSPLTTDLSLLKSCDGVSLTKDQREDILMKIGQGSEKAASLFSRIAGLRSRIAAREPAAEKRSLHWSLGPAGARALVGMEENLRMPVRYAKCCKPQEWPRENIVGNISRPGAVVIHRESCRMCPGINPERRVKVWWL